MKIDITNGRRFNEEPAISAVSSGADIVLVRLADGTGVKALPTSALRDFAAGDITVLETEDKTSLVAAINEIFGLTRDNKDSIDTINTIIEALKTEGATRANALPIEKDLGASFTDEQSADIRGGKFNKVRTGGFWTINGRKYWAGHADYRLHCGDTELTKHHMLVVPDKSFYSHYMNSTNVTTGAYYGSNMVSDGLTQALATVKADFGEAHVLTYRNLLANAVSGDSSSNWAWYDRQIDIMNECMVYGHQAWGAAAHNGYDVGCDKTQIALFQARPDLIANRGSWWLRDVHSPTDFCVVDSYGSANTWYASDVYGVRPAFLIA